MKIRFIGDIHGKFEKYLPLIKGEIDTVQVGDFGIGFGYTTAEFVDSMLSNFGSQNYTHRFIRGNHDDPGEASRSSHFITDGTVEGDIMYIGGALSIDRAWRTEGIDWWSDEELSYSELQSMIDLYDKTRPRILVTHDCPDFFANEAMIPLVRGLKNHPSRTRDALDAMYAIAAPEIHIFGHWHHDVDYQDRGGTGTRFICLNELSYIDLEV